MQGQRSVTCAASGQAKSVVGKYGYEQALPKSEIVDCRKEGGRKLGLVGFQRISGSF
jgi:hypothetical protein